MCSRVRVCVRLHAQALKQTDAHITYAHWTTSGAIVDGRCKCGCTEMQSLSGVS